MEITGNLSGNTVDVPASIRNLSGLEPTPEPSREESAPVGNDTWSRSFPWPEADQLPGSADTSCKKSILYLPWGSMRRFSDFSGKIERPGGFYSEEPGGGKLWVLTVNDGIDKKSGTVNKKHGADTGQTVLFGHERKYKIHF